MPKIANGQRVLKKRQTRSSETEKTIDEFYALLTEKSEEQFEQLHGRSTSTAINKLLLRIGKINSGQACRNFKLKAFENNVLESGLPAHVRLLLLSRLYDECGGPATPTKNDDITVNTDPVSPQVWSSMKWREKNGKLEEWCDNVPTRFGNVDLDLPDKETTSWCKELQQNEIDRIYSGLSWKAKNQIRNGKMNTFHELLEKRMMSDFLVLFKEDLVRRHGPVDERDMECVVRWNLDWKRPESVDFIKNVSANECFEWMQDNYPKLANQIQAGQPASNQVNGNNSQIITNDFLTEVAAQRCDDEGITDVTAKGECTTNTLKKLQIQFGENADPDIEVINAFFAELARSRCEGEQAANYFDDGLIPDFVSMEKEIAECVSTLLSDGF